MAQADGTITILTDLATDGLKRGLKVAAGAVAGAAASLGALGTAAIKVGADFEAGMSTVAAISGATDEELTALTEKAKEMGAVTKFSATESAEAMQYMAQAGWRAEDMISGIEGVMNLAAASGEDLALTSDIVTDALTAFGLEAKDSAHFADVLAKASAASNTNVALMGETFQYVAPVAGALGYSIEDMSVAIGLMANSGIKGSQAGTALRATLTRMAKPTKQSAEAMEQLGVSLTNQDGTMKSFAEVMEDLREGFSGLTEAEKTNMAAALGGQEAMSGLLAIVNASDDDFKKLTKEINNADGAAEDMAETMQDNLKGAVEELGGAAETLGITIYEKIEGPLKDLAQRGAGYINQLTQAFQRGGFDALSTEIGTVLSDIITSIANAAPQVATAATGMIQGLLTGIRDNLPQIVSGAIDTVMAFIEGLLDMLPDIVDTGFQLIVELVKGIADALPELIPDVINTLLDLVIETVTNIPRLIEAGIQLVGGIIQGILQAIPALLEGVVQLFDAMLNGIDPALQEMDKKIDEIEDKCETVSDNLETLKGNTTTSLGEIDAQAGLLQGWIDKLAELEEQGIRTNDQQEEYNRLIGLISEVCPEAVEALDDNAIAGYNAAAALQAYVDNWKMAAKADAYARASAEAMDELVAAEMAATDASNALRTAQQERKTANQELIAAEQAFANALKGTEFAGRDVQEMLLSGDIVYSEHAAELVPLQAAYWDAQNALDDWTAKEGDAQEALKTANATLAEANGVVDGYATSLQTATEAQQAYGEVVTESNGYISDSFEKASGAEKAALQKMIESVVVDGNELTDAQKTVAQNILLAYTGLPDDMKEAGKDSLLGLIAGMEGQIPGLENISEMSADEIVQVLSDALLISSPSRATKEIGGYTTKGLIDGMLDQIPTLILIAKSMGTGIKNTLKKVPKDMVPIGEDISDGIAEGMRNKTGELQRTARELANKITIAFKSALGIHSPSRRLAEEIGLPAAQGIGAGFMAALPETIRDMQRALDAEMLRAPSSVAASSAGAGSVSPGNVYNFNQSISSPVPATAEDLARAGYEEAEATLFRLGVSV